MTSSPPSSFKSSRSIRFGLALYDDGTTSSLNDTPLVTPPDSPPRQSQGGVSASALGEKLSAECLDREGDVSAAANFARMLEDDIDVIDSGISADTHGTDACVSLIDDFTYTAPEPVSYSKSRSRSNSGSRSDSESESDSESGFEYDTASILYSYDPRYRHTYTTLSLNRTPAFLRGIFQVLKQLNPFPIPERYRRYTPNAFAPGSSSRATATFSLARHEQGTWKGQAASLLVFDLLVSSNHREKNLNIRIGFHDYDPPLTDSRIAIRKIVGFMNPDQEGRSLKGQTVSQMQRAKNVKNAKNAKRDSGGSSSSRTFVKDKNRGHGKRWDECSDDDIDSNLLVSRRPTWGQRHALIDASEILDVNLPPKVPCQVVPGQMVYRQPKDTLVRFGIIVTHHRRPFFPDLVVSTSTDFMAEYAVEFPNYLAEGVIYPTQNRQKRNRLGLGQPSRRFDLMSEEVVQHVLKCQ